MSRDLLFLIRPDFQDDGQGPFFCPGCAEVVGLLELYPRLKEHVEIRYVDFVRPRPELVSLLGEENQSCPVLVLKKTGVEHPHIQVARGQQFVEGAREIAEYLAGVHGSGIPH